MTSKKINQAFNKFKNNQDYCSMGQFFWHVFMTQRNDSARKTADKLYDSLTKREKKLCENC